MKTNLIISDACIQCGSCLGLETGWLEETSDGSIHALSGTYVDPDDVKVKELLSICPMSAISVDVSIQRQNPSAVLQQIINELENWKGLDKPNTGVFKFDAKEYPIPVPYPSGQGRYDYSSDRAAERAAEEEFNRIMYSKIDAIILQVISTYRVQKISQFYTKGSDSAYADSNQTVSSLLADAKRVVEQFDVSHLPADFTSFDIYPESDIVWKMLNKGELISDEMISTIRSEFNSGSYSSLSSYRMYFDTDDMERYAGRKFGRERYVTKYCYRDVEKACKELANDLQNALQYCSDQLEDRAAEFVNGLVDAYNQIAAEKLKAKIALLRKIVSST